MFFVYLSFFSDQVGGKVSRRWVAQGGAGAPKGARPWYLGGNDRRRAADRMESSVELEDGGGRIWESGSGLMKLGSQMAIQGLIVVEDRPLM